GGGNVPDLVLEVVARLGGGTDVTFLARSARPLGAEEVDGAAVGVGQEVAAQRPTVGVVAIGLVPQAQEDLLDDLLGERRGGEEAAGEAEHGAGVAAVGRRE